MRRASAAALFAFFLPALAACSPREDPPANAVRFVETVVVAAEPVSEAISTTGEIKARVQSDLSFRVSGRITDRLVDVGDHVKAGQVLARIDNQEQTADLQVAMASLLSAEAQQTQAQRAFDRQDSLFKASFSTRAALDSAKETLLRATATVESAQAAVDTARDALDQADLQADADGVITARSVEVGQVAQAAQLVFTLAHDGPRDAVLSADETVLLGRELDNEVEVRPIAGGAAMKAKVREVSPTIDKSTGTVRIKLGLEGDPDVRLGSPVIAIGHYKPMNMIELPWSSMTSDAGQPAVWVVDPKTNAVSIRPVEVMNYGRGKFAVRSGVKPGEIVVASGSKFLSAGEIVAFDGAAK
ncbi:efflux RND transporter periplasmic adaptor subunit [Kaistia algarum]|uniref:efflux RND transporter periplasmic adaptor subunit n=1 Tax=Kaistia algarum TaxID=2083279 RepID=UPI000CE7B14E|nr:efflux RND transporter periplasmic adaptor subunit [Kaistia algarum]